MALLQGTVAKIEEALEESEERNKVSSRRDRLIVALIRSPRRSSPRRTPTSAYVDGGEQVYSPQADLNSALHSSRISFAVPRSRSPLCSSS